MATFAALSDADLKDAIQRYKSGNERFDVAPTKKQLLGRSTIYLLVLNRTIGAGIFTVPPKVLAGTGSVGGSLLIWFSCGIVVLCGTLCWLELGLTIPLVTIKNGTTGDDTEVSAPRSGGEKNFLEYIYNRPKFLMPCIYGIMYIVLGNISGNAIAFGIYVMIAAGRDPVNDHTNHHQKGPVLGLAVAVLTLCAFLHIFSRRSGIWINNFFGVVKISMLLAIAILGFVHAGKKYLQSSGITDQVTSSNGTMVNIDSPMINKAANNNLDIHTSFSSPRGDVASYVNSFLYVLYSYTGYEQPFYVLSEVEKPRKRFPKYTLLGMGTAVLLYILVNVSYFCVVPKETYTSSNTNTIDMAGSFFYDLFDSTDGAQRGKRIASGLIAFSILGNILAITFTAARVKQEIAKEAILPYSLIIASGMTTPLAWLRSRKRARTAQNTASSLPRLPGGIEVESHLEQSPVAALALHWITSIILILVTSMLKPAVAYSFLVSLFSYVDVAVVGFLVSGGLLYLKIDSWIRGDRGRNWAGKVKFTPPWIDPVHAIVYFLAMGFFLIAPFVPPPSTSPFTKTVMGYWWFLVPSIGICSLSWGVMWWLGLEAIQRHQKKALDVMRRPFVVRDKDGNYTQLLEFVQHEWRAVLPSERQSGLNGGARQRFRSAEVVGDNFELGGHGHPT
ncbi:hypothetical protein V496_01536 [Pseudogymnoascus sp. VKM F-4515 (FW-2607)]|nr:hypothetical protein V496_01536 [Pseudogymnoascus sp. VKM F-4515 (FW-2607)]KFY95824.1 hypothetical protein V498_03100 [Pseudogymnoascus sp. VKM F-4517 (FW-2822)]